MLAAGQPGLWPLHGRVSPCCLHSLQCKIAGTVGFAKASEKGGASYSIPLKTVSVGGFTF